MRSCSLVLFSCVVLSWSSRVFAQDFETAGAKQAQERFLAALKSAQDTYASDLEIAAKQAVADNNLEEVVRIKEKIDDLKSQQQLDRGDPVVRLRRRLKDTTWTFLRSDKPNTPETMKFHAGNRVTKVLGNRQATGVWESIESKVAIVKFKDTLFLFEFDDGVRSFRVVAFGPLKTVYTSGRRIR